MSRFLQIHHTSLLVADLTRALHFYVDVLGLEIDESRPPMAFDGAWLKVGAQQIHLLQLPSPDPVNGRPAHAGRDRHSAFLVTDLGAVEDCLQRAAVPFTRSRSGRPAIFCRDPDGNGIELIEAQDVAHNRT